MTNVVTIRTWKTCREAAAIVGVSRATLTRWHQYGKIPEVRFFKGKLEDGKHYHGRIYEEKDVSAAVRYFLMTDLSKRSYVDADGNLINPQPAGYAREYRDEAE